MAKQYKLIQRNVIAYTNKMGEIWGRNCVTSKKIVAISTHQVWIFPTELVALALCTDEQRGEYGVTNLLLNHLSQVYN